MPEEEKPALVSIKDLAGLSGPLTKLIETIQAGCGRVANVLWLNKKEADNEVYRTIEVGRAETTILTERVQAIGLLSGQGQQIEKVDITAGSVQAQLRPEPTGLLELVERGNSRVAFQTAMRQKNIEVVLQHAAEVLEQETEVSAEPVGQAFVNSFFRSVEDASEPAVQALWGRILAGEIKKPGSFSLRTLALLQTLTQVEGQDFEKLCAYVWHAEDGVPVAIIHSYGAIAGAVQTLTFACLNHLADIGLIDFKSISGPFATGTFGFSKSAVQLAYNGTIISITKTPAEHSTPFISSGRVLLTQIGRELAPVCKPEYDSSIMEDAVKEWIKKGHELSSAYPKRRAEFGH